MQAAAALQHYRREQQADSRIRLQGGLLASIEYNLVTLVLPCPSPLHTVYKAQPPATVSAK